MSLSGGITFSGVFVQTGRILSAKSISNKTYNKDTKQWEDNGTKPVDVGIEVEIEIKDKDGNVRDFTNKITLAGNFKEGADANEWSGSAYRTKIFLEDMRIGKYNLGADNSIPQDVLDKIIGKEVAYLRYPGAKNGEKTSYYTYKRIILASFKNKAGQDAEAFLKEKYNNDVTNGYVKPLVDEDTSFPGPVDTAAEVDNNF